MNERVIRVRGASEHNLKGIDVDIPRGALTVVTGVSGSGKSSLAFDTIGAEGRRRYLETFSSYARQFLGKLSRPAVNAIENLSPAVALDQSAGVASPRSTVGTLTEIYDLLRLLWARAGQPTGDGSAPSRPSRALFSFNSPVGACPRCKGLGVEDRLDPELLVEDAGRSIRDGALRITTPTGYVIYSQVTLDVLDQVCRAHGFSVDVPWRDLTAAQRDIVLNGSERIRIPYGKHPLASRLRWSGITAKPREEGVYKGILPVMEQILRAKRNRNILRFVRSMPCQACGGSRLRREALAVRYGDMTIAQASAMTVSAMRRFFEERAARGAEPIGRAIAAQIVQRCGVLQDLGLGYLAIDRESTTLSAGEAQRIRVARQASVGLSGLLYVLDEPSVGLHAHDTARLLGVLRTLRDRGNTVLVVEHDEQVMREADWLVDVGPGAGESGGALVYSGTVAQFVTQDPASRTAAAGASPTRAYLTGEQRIPVPRTRRPGSGDLELAGISRHNLHDVRVAFKLGAFNVITGVSGAGKSTLVDEVVRRLADVQTGQAGRRGGAGRALEVIHIDQAPIGRTPRSNPATYTGLFDAVRDVFAREPEALARGFDKGRFSFNVKGGRCDACEGAGVQQVGMQFLGSVSIPCEACGGRRFNEATLAVRYRGKDIHQVLEMPIDEAAGFFADQAAIARPLAALRSLGLGYVALGQPATMLSGGEAQRVKLATQLARPEAGRTLYVLDEPTTGLHAADVALLLHAIDRLVSGGNTVMAIEHHLDVIKVADWVVDLGPGSGEDGGRIVATGTPESVAADDASLTGLALRPVLTAPSLPPLPPDPPLPSLPPEAAPIRLTNVTTHNLQHVDVDIPTGCLTVVTGVSGSGKSSLAFDTLFAEAQQRYAETFATWARRYVQRASEAEFERAEGLTPAVAIGQHRPSRNPRSTVATMTEIHDLYRLLFSRAGTRLCPACGHTLERGRCGRCGFGGAATLTAAMFSPNSEQGACPRCNGLGHMFDCDVGKLITDPSRPLSAGAMAGHRTGRFYGDPHGQHMAILAAAGRALDLDFSEPWSALDEGARSVAMRGAGDRTFDVEWHYVRGKRSGVHRFQSAWRGLQAYVREEYERKHADRRGEALEPLMVAVPCDACAGGKLKPEFLAVRFHGANIAELLALTVDDTVRFFETLDAGERRKITSPSERILSMTSGLRSEILRRLRRVQDASLGYLSLDRLSTTLSGGEAQRVRLAGQIGAGLTGITYVLDEPTAGLHPRDTARLVGLLRALTGAGNTVVVVEHDEDVLRAADHVIEMGPGAGPLGGRIVAAGRAADGTRPLPHPARTHRALVPGITIEGADVHNLRNLDVDVPAGGLIAVTGVSGSGKSSLVFDVLARSLDRSVAGGHPVNCRNLGVRAPFSGVVVVNRGLGGSPWATPATHIGVFDAIRDWFAASDCARSQGLRSAHFSTTVKGGRCEVCEGVGQVRVSMDFLPDVWTTCEECGGRRYNREALECRVGGRSIADVLDMSIDEADDWAGRLPDRMAKSEDVRRRLAVLREVGLGYVHVGQPARTLSGGERQRLVLAAGIAGDPQRREMGRRPRRCDDGHRTSGSGHVPTSDVGPRTDRLYLLDEPTLGLHAKDIAQLLRVFDRLIVAGHTIVVVEHNLDVIAQADWVIDLGPEGGPGGGRLVATGPPATIAASIASYTGRALRDRQAL